MSELHRLVRSRCALTVQAASKNNQGDGALSALLQLETQPASAVAAAADAAPTDIRRVATRLIECELSPAQLFTLLAALEEAQAKLNAKQHGDQ